MFKEINDFFYNYLYRIGAWIVSSLIGIVSFSLVAGLLGEEGYGQLSVFRMVCSFILLLAASWIASAIVRYGKEEFIRTNSIKETFWSALAIWLVVIPIAEIVLYLFRESITSYIGIPQGSISLVMLYIIVVPLVTVISISFQVSERLKTFSSIPLLNSILFLLFIVLMKVGIFSPKVTTIVALAVISNLLTGIAFLIFVERKYLLPISISKDVIKRILLYSYPLIFGGMSVFIIDWIDIAVIKEVSTVDQVGVYSVAYRFMLFLTPLAMLSIDLTFPIVTALFVSKREDAIKVFVSRLTPQMLFAWALLISVILVLMNVMINFLLGTQFKQSVMPATILVFGIIFRAIGAFQSPVISTYALILPNELIGISMGVANFFGDWLLIPRFGIVAAAAITTFLYFLESVFRTVIIDRRLKSKSFKNFAIISPVIPVMMVCLLTSNLPIRVITLMITFSIAVLVIKKNKIYDIADAQMFEAIKVPQFLRQIIFRTYNFLSYQPQSQNSQSNDSEGEIKARRRN